MEEAVAALDISAEGGENALQNADAAADKDAKKKAEQNRKKREKAKAKKAAEKAETEDPAGLGRWAKGKLPGGRAERRDAGTGRGLGVYATEPIVKDEVIASAVPALSVVFDSAAESVCGFCFKAPEKGATTEHEVELKSAEGSGFGLNLDNYTPPGAEKPVTLVTRVTHESANIGVVQLGDRIQAVEGQPVAGGYDKAVPLLKKAVEDNHGKATCTLERPCLLDCPGEKFVCCSDCVGAGRMRWHSYEAAMLQTLNGIEKAGESSTVRMLLRYRLSTEPKVGEWCAEKEPIGLLTSLQATGGEKVPPQQLANLAKVSSLPAADVAKLIGQVRTNACEVTRRGEKVGMALSVLTGWHNHSCLPNAQSTVDEDGKVAVRALRDIEADEEVTISYIDAMQDYDVRRKTLKEHYGFDCSCARCALEEKAALKKAMEVKRQYLAGQRR